MSNVFYTMPITLVQFLMGYLPTPKSDFLYERSPGQFIPRHYFDAFLELGNSESYLEPQVKANRTV